jgi:hypothetical protein
MKSLRNVLPALPPPPYTWLITTPLADAAPVVARGSAATAPGAATRSADAQAARVKAQRARRRGRAPRGRARSGDRAAG